MQTKTSETKVQDTCDTLIAWGFRCSATAAFLVKRINSPEYAIMCEKHRRGFQNQYPREEVIYHKWSLELNQKFADEANQYWKKELINK